MSAHEINAEATLQIKRYRRLLRKAYSTKNRRTFLQNCIHEKVLPKSTAKILKADNHPFPNYARDYLYHSAQKLKHEETELFEKARSIGISLRNSLSAEQSNQIRHQLTRANNNQITNLQNKLKVLCINSQWKSLGNPNLINNLSDITLSQNETEALSFGLKFATGISKKSEVCDTIIKNYHSQDTDFEKGFIQGIITSSLSSTNETSLPRRYITALKNLSKRQDITITSSDKGGGIVIMNTNTYNDKMMDLLNDTNTYTTTTFQEITHKTEILNKDLRSIFKRYKASNWNKYLETHPKIPKIYGLPKTHKENIPLRPIVSGIGSALHKIARNLAKSLTPLLGTISNSHLKHSGDLLNRLKDVNGTRIKKLASLDVKSLYTNIPVKKCLTQIKAHFKKKNIPTSFPIDDFFNLIEKCTNHCYLEYNGVYYQQKSGLPMGSPLSGVLACLYLELLEDGPYKNIIPKNSFYVRYIDDILLICPTRTNIKEIVEKLNQVDVNIQFTLEEEHDDNTLPFLDVNIHRTNDGLHFSVYRKSTYKNDLTHYFSHHDNQTKMGILIGFYIRAIRICSPQHLDDEYKYLEKCFTELKYPKHFINKARRKAEKIKTRPEVQTEATPKKRIILSTSNEIRNIKQELAETYKIAVKTSMTIKELIRKPVKKEHTGSIYKIPCHECDKVYIGETSRKLPQRIQEHKRALRTDDTTNAVAQHRTTLNHRININESISIHKEDNLRKRRLIESAMISQDNTFEQRPGFFNLADNLAQKILKIHKIPFNDTNSNTHTHNE